METLPQITPTDQSALALPDVPPRILALLQRWLPAILAWVSAWHTRRLLHACRRDPLVLLQRAYDFAPVIAQCAAYYHNTGPGAPPTYDVALLLRAEFLRVWFGNLSDRALEALLLANGLARWFVGLHLVDDAPDHTTRSRFHVWLTDQQGAKALFYTALAHIDRLDPEDPAATPQICDTFALRTAAATDSPAVILLYRAFILVTQWQRLAPPALVACLPPLDLDALQHPPSAFTPAQRAPRTQFAVDTARLLDQTLTPLLPHLDPDVRRILAADLDLLRKAMDDEFQIDGATGVATERPLKAKGTFRMVCACDPDATMRKHGDHADPGFNAGISVTATRIRAAVVATGSTADSDFPVLLLEQHLQEDLPLPPSLTMDMAGGRGKTRTEVDLVSAGATRMVAKIPPTAASTSGRYTPADFTLDPDTQTLTCPNHVTTSQSHRHGGGSGTQFVFTAEQCAGCPLVVPCRDPQAKPTSERRVFKSDHAPLLEEAKAFNASAAGTALLQQRYQVEPNVAWLVCFDGCREARRVGLAAAQELLFMACAVRNLKRWIARIRRGQAAAPWQGRGSAPPLPAPSGAESA